MKQVWLNKESSPSTGNVVAYDGVSIYKGGTYRNTFLSVSDCYTSALLHKNDVDTRTTSLINCYHYNF